MEPITRKAAKASGLKFYFTGKPCKRGGHIDKRYVTSFCCMTCNREKALDTFRSLDAGKRQSIRERNKQLWQDPTYRARALQYERQRDKATKREANREWKQANRWSCTDRENKRRALYLNAFVEDVSLAFLFERDNGQCRLCGCQLSMDTKRPNPKTPTRDHIVPLSKGGTHERANMQLACDECNVRKGARCA